MTINAIKANVRAANSHVNMVIDNLNQWQSVTDKKFRCGTAQDMYVRLQRAHEYLARVKNEIDYDIYLEKVELLNLIRKLIKSLDEQ